MCSRDALVAWNETLPGDIYDVASRQKCAKLKGKSLDVVEHTELLGSKDLKTRATAYLRSVPSYAVHH